MIVKEFHSRLLGYLRFRDDRDDMVVRRYKLKYRKGKYDFLRIASKKIGPEDKVILIRAGIHGDETAGPLTILHFCNVIIDYIHYWAKLKCIIYPLANPLGFEEGERYNSEFDREKYHEGNNDFLRYRLENGNLCGDIGSNGTAYKNWHWSSDPKLNLYLPEETKLMHKLLAKDPLSQIAAVIDLHQDYKSDFSAIPHAYHYAFGNLACYQGIVKKIEEVVPILRNTDVEAEESPPEKSDDCGFIIKHDGTLPDLMFRLGVKHCITAETTGATSPEAARIVNLIWIFGITDLLRKGD